jgi:hypothetical protein
MLLEFDFYNTPIDIMAVYTTIGFIIIAIFTLVTLWISYRRNNH